MSVISESSSSERARVRPTPPLRRLPPWAAVKTLCMLKSMEPSALPPGLLLRWYITEHSRHAQARRLTRCEQRGDVAGRGGTSCGCSLWPTSTAPMALVECLPEPDGMCKHCAAAVHTSGWPTEAVSPPLEIGSCFTHKIAARHSSHGRPCWSMCGSPCGANSAHPAAAPQQQQQPAKRHPPLQQLCQGQQQRQRDGGIPQL